MAPPPPDFDASGVSGPDAVVTIRSLRRRFAEAFDQAEDPAHVTAPAAGGASDWPPGPAGPSTSAVQHAAWAAHALDMIGTALHKVLVADRPTVELPPVDPPGPLGDADSPAAALAQLGDRAGALADAMAEVHGKDWSRTGLTSGGEMSALDIVRLAVKIGIEHLRAAQEAVTRQS